MKLSDATLEAVHNASMSEDVHFAIKGRMAKCLLQPYLDALNGEGARGTSPKDVAIGHCEMIAILNVVLVESVFNDADDWPEAMEELLKGITECSFNKLSMKAEDRREKG